MYTIQGSLLGRSGPESSWYVFCIAITSPWGRIFEIALRRVDAIFASQLLKVVETSFLAENDRNGHIYMSVMKQHML